MSVYRLRFLTTYLMLSVSKHSVVPPKYTNTAGTSKSHTSRGRWVLSKNADFTKVQLLVLGDFDKHARDAPHEKN